MAFPLTEPVPVGVELYYSTAWNDITPDVRGPVTITRGQASEQSSGAATPSRMTFTLNNRTGDYSPRNPNSPLFGLIGRNTDIRAYVELGTPRAVYLSGADYFTAPDSAALSITGDIDLRTDVDLPSWRPFEDTYVGVYKGNAYGFFVGTDGLLFLFWYDSGAVLHAVSSTEPVSGSQVGRKAVRATLDVNNGAAGHTVAFYTADPGDLTGASWTQLGTSVVTAGTTSIANTADQLLIYTGFDGSEVYDVEVRDGIAGTIVAKPDFTTRTNGATSFSDSYSNTYTAAGDAVVTNRHYLFHGNVPAWPQRWDVTGSDVWVPIEAAGPLRRISQGTSPLDSAYKKGALTALPNCVAYWAMEDEASSTRFDAAIGGRYGTWVGTPRLAVDSSFACSLPLPAMDQAGYVLPVPSHAFTNTDGWQIRWLGEMPAATPTNTVIMRARTNSTCARIDLVYTTGGALTLKVYDTADVLISTIGPVAFAVDGLSLRFSVDAKQNGANVDLTMVTLVPGASTGSSSGGSAASLTLGRVTKIEFNPGRAVATDLVVGHVTYENVISTAFSNDDQLAAYDGELAHQRVYRMCTENGIGVDLLGYGGDGQTMSTQPVASVLDVIYEAVAVDGGLLYEPRQTVGLAMRTLNSLYNQDPTLTIAYTDNNLQSFEPTEDDQTTRNRVTVTRKNASSATVEDTTSALSTQDPPLGVGIYDEALTLSLWTDSQTPAQAGWRVHMGTVDEARYPQIGVRLEHPDFAGSPTQLRQALLVDVGDRIDVTGLPSWLPPERVEQIVLGQTIVLNNFECSITYNCRPARAFRVAQYLGGGLDRFDNGYSQLDGAHTSGATSLSVDVPYLPLWSIADGSFDIMVAGERMTVTNITGASSPQTFTVTRSVNGVVKAQADAAVVTLFDPVYIGL